jgi:hypothetical protein
VACRVRVELLASCEKQPRFSFQPVTQSVPLRNSSSLGRCALRSCCVEHHKLFCQHELSQHQMESLRPKFTRSRAWLCCAGGILVGFVIAAVVAATVLGAKAPGPETLQTVSQSSAFQQHSQHTPSLLSVMADANACCAASPCLISLPTATLTAHNFFTKPRGTFVSRACAFTQPCGIHIQTCFCLAAWCCYWLLTADQRDLPG